MKKILLFLSIFLFSTNSFSSDHSFMYNLDYDERPVECSDLKDPLEKINRKIFYFNSVLDYVILRPVARAYMLSVNKYLQERVSNIILNLGEPFTSFNYMLQADPNNSMKSFWKFYVNTFFGPFGAYNVAEKFDLKTTPQTFGSTLAYYGASPGPYIVLPILGSTNLRDMWDGIFVDDALNITKYHLGSVKTTYTLLKMVNDRAEIMPFTDQISSNSTDPYAAIRSALHQNRQKNLRYPEGYICGVRPKKSKK